MRTQCLECGFDLFGRADKKFCNDQCRTNYHNRKNNADTFFIKPVNKILRKNRLILKKVLNGSRNQEISMDELLKHGFDFNFYTHKKIINENSVWLCVYEFKYIQKSRRMFRIACDLNEIKRFTKESLVSIS